MSSTPTAIFGFYSTPEAADQAIDHLQELGFSRGDMSVLVPDNENTRVLAQRSALSVPDPEATTAVLSTGGIVGGGLGLLAGLGELAVPGIGPLMAAGPIASTLFGVAVGGTLGGLVGALISIGIPEYEAKLYEGAVKGGGVLLSIHCKAHDQVTHAMNALIDTGAHEVASTCEEISDENLGEQIDHLPVEHAL